MIDRQSVKDTVVEYAKSVVEGDIVAGKPVRWACRRFLVDLKNKEWQYEMDWRKATRAVNFFMLLEHTTSQYDGQSFELYPWQQFIVANIFGWCDKETKRRRFRRAMVSVGRGNGKSPLSAGITLYGFCCDEPREANAKGFSVATKRDQARIIFDEMRQFIDRSPALKEMLVCTRDYIEIPDNYSRYIPLSSEGKSADGLNPHMIAVDELHAWKKEHKELWDKLETALAKRPQPLLLITTTAGSEESELWVDEHHYCIEVLDPDSKTNDESTFAYIAEIDDEDNELDEAAWPKANPMLEYGIVKIDALRSLASQASVNKAKQHEFRRYHGNKLTVSINKPITYEKWAIGNGELPSLTGLPCYLGFDWGWKNDLTALGYVFPIDQTEVGGTWRNVYAIGCDCWIPAEGGRDLSREPFRTWIEEGLLTVTAGSYTDTQAIYRRMEDVVDEFQVCSVAFDQNNGREFGSRCVNEWGLKTIAFGQTTGRYHEPLQELQTALSDGRLIHGGNPILAWAATNMAIRTDDRGYSMPVKQRSQDKIDPIVAVIMGLSEAMLSDCNIVRYEKGSLRE